MALTLEIDQASPILKQLKHVNASITDGALATLISGIAGKRIRIWRLHAHSGSALKICIFYSGADEILRFNNAGLVLPLQMKSSDGVPVLTCNVGDDFKADPSDVTNWYFYIVYSIE